MSLKRLLKPASVREAKSAATRLKDFLSSRNIDISRSLSLKSLSVAAGYRDWNTFHGVLMRGEKDPEEVVSIEMAKINRVLCVAVGCETECIDALKEICGLNGVGNDMWRRRAENLLTNAVNLHFSMAEHERQAPCLTGIRETMGLPRFCKTLMRLEKEAPGLRLAPYYDFLQTIPGLEMSQIRCKDKLGDKSLEQWGFLEMALTKPILRMIES